MTIRNLNLDYLKLKKKKLEDEVSKIQRELSVTNDVLTIDKLEKRQEYLFEDIDANDQEIEAIEHQQQQDQAATRARELVELLSVALPAEANLIKTAYQATLSHRRVPLRDAAEPAAYVRELNRISPGTFAYTALEEFIARLVGRTQEIGLITDLQGWGTRHYPERNWLDLYNELEQASQTDLRPAILITLTLAEEATTQAANQPHYQLRAWLVEDMDTYRQSKGGCHALIAEGQPEAKPFAGSEDLTQFISAMKAELGVDLDQLLDRFIEKTNQRCPEIRHQPEFHIFLPTALMALAVDQWLLGDHTPLGYDYRVLVRCIDRYTSAYRKAVVLRRLWTEHQQCQSNPARPQFIAWDGQLETLREILLEADETKTDLQRPTVLGLHCTTAPPPDGRAVFAELLRVGGLPLVLWARCQVPTICNQTRLEELLQATLADLPGQIDQKRREARRVANPPDRHIGHHLFLLRDDPTLPPPKRA